MPNILRIFGTGVPKYRGVEFPMTPGPSGGVAGQDTELVVFYAPKPWRWLKSRKKPSLTCHFWNFWLLADRCFINVSLILMPGLQCPGKGKSPGLQLYIRGVWC